MYRLEGHAIVSADDRIADEHGVKPRTLHHPADWARFQSELDRAVLVVLGRRSHEASPDQRGRPRLVVSRAVRSLERRGDAWWWNPEEVPLEDALSVSAPRGGTVAIPGGRGVFDLFLDLGYHAFHLTRDPRVTLPGGVPIFGSVAEGVGADAVLRAAGLVPVSSDLLDARAGVTVTVFRRGRGGPYTSLS